jgi:hypothetical protein
LRVAFLIIPDDIEASLHFMRLSRKARIFSGFLCAAGVVATGVIAVRVAAKPQPGSAEANLAQGDEMAFNNNWIGAASPYRKAQVAFFSRGDSARALYAEASQIPAVMESRSLPDLIAATNQLLQKPGAGDPQTRLRILTVRGMLELEYDAGQAKNTWQEVEAQAKQLGERRLASRASGEQGILAFLLGDVAEASRRVTRAYLMAKVLFDYPAQVRYASLIGRGLAEFERYQESLDYLDRAATGQLLGLTVLMVGISGTNRVNSTSVLRRNYSRRDGNGRMIAIALMNTATGSRAVGNRSQVRATFAIDRRA